MLLNRGISKEIFLPALLIFIGVMLIFIGTGVFLVRSINRGIDFQIKDVLMIVTGGIILAKGVLTLPIIQDRFQKFRLQDVFISSRTDGSLAIKRWIIVLGSVNLLSLGFYSVMSFFLAPVFLPSEMGDVKKIEVYEGGVRLLAYFGLTNPSLVSNGLDSPGYLLLVYSIPLVLVTGVFVSLLLLLRLYNQYLTYHIPNMLFNWTVFFALITMFAVPVLIPDFWLSTAWGRQIASGINPYYIGVTEELLYDIPIDYIDYQMTYGPLWAIISGLVMWISRGYSVWGALLFKGILAASWIGSVWLVWQLLKKQSIWVQSVGILIFGWLPLSIIHGIADGHNDIVMAFFVLLWLYGLKHDNVVVARLALTAAVLIKYVVVPLFFLDFLFYIITRRRSLTQYIWRVSPSIVFAIIIFGLFFRDINFFDPLSQHANWRFYSPTEAGLILEQLIFGYRIGVVSRIFTSVFWVAGFYYGVRYLLYFREFEFWLASLAGISLILFSIFGYVWPWYLIWVLGFVALVPKSALSRWLLGIILISPFYILIWVLFPTIGHYYIFDLPTIFLYGFALVWLVFFPKDWVPELSEFVSSTDSHIGVMSHFR